MKRLLFGSEPPEDETGPGPPNSKRVQESPTESVKAVEISPGSGTYPSFVTVSLSYPTDGAKIHYTLDGGVPDEASSVYDPNEPLLLHRSAVLRAYASVEGRESSAVSEAEYDVQAPEWQQNEPEDCSDEVLHEFAKEGTRSDGWRIAGASLRGRLHAHHGLWREDFFDFDSTDGWTVIAVSDGAGSAPLSRVGSRLACETSLNRAIEGLEGFDLSSESEEDLKKSDLPYLQRLLADTGRVALAAMRQEATERNQKPEDFAATLLVVVHHAWRGRHLVGAVQVGDGSIALLDWNGDLTLLGAPDHGDQSGETRFLTTQGVEETLEHRVLFSVKSHLRCIVTMSDGVSDDFFPEEKRLVGLLLDDDFAGMMDREGHSLRGVLKVVAGENDPKEKLLEWLRYTKRGSSDDRTLVLFWDAR